MLDGTAGRLRSKLGYLKASVALGLKHPDVGPEFIRYLLELRNTR